MATQPNKIDDDLGILVEKLWFIIEFLNVQMKHIQAAITTLPDQDGLLPKVDKVLGSLEKDFTIDIKSLTFDAIMKRIQVVYAKTQKAQAHLVALKKAGPWTAKERITAYLYMRIIVLNMQILRFLILKAKQLRANRLKNLSRLLLAKSRAIKRRRQIRRDVPQQTVNPVVPVIPVEPENPEAIVEQERQLHALFLQLDKIFDLLTTDVIPKIIEEAQKTHTLLKKEQNTHKDIITLISSIQFKLEQLQKLRQPANPSNMERLTLWAHQQHKGATRAQQEQLMDKCLQLLADPNHISSVEEKKGVLKGLMLFIQGKIAEEIFTRPNELNTLANETVKDLTLENINAIKALKDFKAFVNSNPQILPKQPTIDQIELQITKAIQQEEKAAMRSTPLLKPPKAN